MSAPAGTPHHPVPGSLDAVLSALRDLARPYIAIDPTAQALGPALYWVERIAFDRVLDMHKPEQRRLYLKALERQLEEADDGLG